MLYILFFVCYTGQCVVIFIENSYEVKDDSYLRAGKELKIEKARLARMLN